jgi:hypothetical protein
MWTLNGAHVGLFGQANPWSIETPSTFRSSSPPLPEPHSTTADALHGGIAAITEPNVDRTLPATSSSQDSSKGKNKGGLQQPTSLDSQHTVVNRKSSTMLRAHLLTDVGTKNGPRVGDVWVQTYRDGNDSENGGKYLHVVTIISVNSAQDTVKVWQGLQSRAVVNSEVLDKEHEECSLSDFFKSGDKTVWSKEPVLSGLIGKVLQVEESRKGEEDEGGGKCRTFKVLFVRWALVSGGSFREWTLVDTDFQQQRLSTVGNNLIARSTSELRRVTRAQKMTIAKTRLGSVLKLTNKSTCAADTSATFGTNNSLSGGTDLLGPVQEDAVEPRANGNADNTSSCSSTKADGLQLPTPTSTTIHAEPPVPLSLPSKPMLLQQLPFVPQKPPSSQKRVFRPNTIKSQVSAARLERQKIASEKRRVHEICDVGQRRECMRKERKDIVNGAIL